MLHVGKNAVASVDGFLYGIHRVGMAMPNREINSNVNRCVLISVMVFLMVVSLLYRTKIINKECNLVASASFFRGCNKF